MCKPLLNLIRSPQANNLAESITEKQMELENQKQINRDLLQTMVKLKTKQKEEGSAPVSHASLSSSQQI